MSGYLALPHDTRVHLARRLRACYPDERVLDIMHDRDEQANADVAAWNRIGRRNVAS